ncbi:MAG: hypothetical protein AAGJ87_07910, partial [Pseudomonadota bacterium]
MNGGYISPNRASCLGSHLEPPSISSKAQKTVALRRSGAKKTVLKLTFARQLSYAKNEGFRTAQPSLPFEVIQRLRGQNEENFKLENGMAHRGRFE